MGVLINRIKPSVVKEKRAKWKARRKARRKLKKGGKRNER
jgi:hypothetical protein